MGVSIVRVVLGLTGACLLIGGLAIAFTGWFPEAFIGAFWMITSGTVLLIAVVIERSRYRSQSAEASNAAPGPGGGEKAPPEPRFKRTDELFVDPTTQLRMRVFTDPQTGERRYVAGG